MQLHNYSVFFTVCTLACQVGALERAVNSTVFSFCKLWFVELLNCIVLNRHTARLYNRASITAPQTRPSKMG